MKPHAPRSNDDWLDDLLARSAALPPADDGFSARVMQRVDSLASAAIAAEPAACLAPDAALMRLPAMLKRAQRRRSWTTAGVVAAAGIGLLTLWAQPTLVTAIALVLTSIGLPWLLLRDPQF